MSGALGFLTLGYDYAKSADALRSEIEEGRLSLNHVGPVDYLYAHSLELLLKSSLLFSDPETEPSSYSHDLNRLYLRVLSLEAGPVNLREIENRVRGCWRVRLRSARDRRANSLMDFGVDKRGCADLGLPSNQNIGDELPELKRQIAWLSARHASNGGRFRYLQTGHDRRQKVQQFGLEDDVVWVSVGWACDCIHSDLHAHALSLRGTR